MSKSIFIDGECLLCFKQALERSEYKELLKSSAAIKVVDFREICPACGQEADREGIMGALNEILKELRS